MKTKLCLIAIACVLVSHTACKKEQEFEINDIYRKWRLVETYSGYENGGSHTWHDVLLEDSYSLSFSTNGEYLKRTSSQQCKGTFQVLTENVLSVNSDCGGVTTSLKISNLTPNELIIDAQVIEGIVRWKYIAEK